MSDGGRAFGSFVYDTLTNTYSSINIMTTPGVGVTSGAAVLAGKNYGTNLIAGFQAPNQLLTTSSNPIVIGSTNWFGMQFASLLTDGGGAVLLQTGILDEGPCIGIPCTNFGAEPRRSIIAGKVIAVSVSGPKTWYFSNVKFEDGGQAEGSFLYDATTNAYGNIDVWVTGGSTFPALLHYTTAKTPPGNAASSSLVALVANTNASVSGDRIFFGALSAFMTNNGGTINFNINVNGARELSCGAVNCTALTTPARLMTSGQITTAKPTGYNKILSDIVDGGGFQSTILATNLTDVAASFAISFFGDNGSPLSIPGIGTSTAVNVPARGTIALTSTGTGALQQGWARVDGADDFNVSVVFKLKNANAAGDVENAVFGEPVGITSITFPFDNTNGAVGGLALTNANAITPVRVQAVAYDEAGTILISNTNLLLPANGHTAFNFQNQAGFTSLAGKRGLLRLFAIPEGGDASVPFNGLNGLLLRFLPNLTNTTVQAIHQ